MTKTALALAFAAGTLGLADPACAQLEEAPLETDRPDITEVSTVVGPGRFQIETSVLVEYFNGRRVDERNFFTPTLFRYGLDNRWEVRLETDGYSRSRVSAGGDVFRTAGYSPVAPGFKYHIQDPREGSSRPSLGLIFHLNVPSGSSVFSTDKVTGDLKLAADWELAPKWELGVNAGFGTDDDEGETFFFALATAALSRELTDRLRTYVELALATPEASGGGRPGLIFDGGFAYLLNANNQLDIAFGTGLTGRSTPDFYWTVGYSVRF